MEIVEARPADFEEVYRLLQQLNNPAISRAQWQRTYQDPFNVGGFPGYLLKDSDGIVGYFGTIFSKRRIAGKDYNFCNCHSWVVDKAHRTKGLMLLNKIHKLKDHILTIFSASADTYGIYKQLRWQEIDNSHSIFFLTPILKSPDKQTQVLGMDKMNGELNDEEKKIAEDHRAYNCSLNVLRSEQEQTLQVFKQLDYFPAKLSAVRKYVPWKLRLGQLYYSSNPSFFFNDFKAHISAICKKEKWIGVVVPNRMLKGAGISNGRKYYKNRPVLIKNDQGMDLEQFDLLYSEVFTLDLN
jgi:hypothetical protein